MIVLTLLGFIAMSVGAEPERHFKFFCVDNMVRSEGNVCCLNWLIAVVDGPNRRRVFDAVEHACE